MGPVETESAFVVLEGLGFGGGFKESGAGVGRGDGRKQRFGGCGPGGLGDLAGGKDLRVGLAGGDGLAGEAGEDGSKIGAADAAGKGVLAEVAAAFGGGGDGDVAGVDALGEAGSLVVGEKGDGFVKGLAADGGAELVLAVGGAVLREVVAGVEGGVAEEFECGAVELRCAGLGDDEDLAAAGVAVFGVEVGSEDTEAVDGVEIGDDGGAHVYVFLDVAAVDAESVGGFALAADGEVAGVGVAGGRG